MSFWSNEWSLFYWWWIIRCKPFRSTECWPGQKKDESSEDRLGRVRKKIHTGGFIVSRDYEGALVWVFDCSTRFKPVTVSLNKIKPSLIVSLVHIMPRILTLYKPSCVFKQPMVMFKPSWGSWGNLEIWNPPFTIMDEILCLIWHGKSVYTSLFRQLTNQTEHFWHARHFLSPAIRRKLRWRIQYNISLWYQEVSINDIKEVHLVELKHTQRATLSVCTA